MQNIKNYSLINLTEHEHKTRRIPLCANFTVSSKDKGAESFLSSKNYLLEEKDCWNNVVYRKLFKTYEEAQLTLENDFVQGLLSGSIYELDAPK